LDNKFQTASESEKLHSKQGSHWHPEIVKRALEKEFAGRAFTWTKLTDARGTMLDSDGHISTGNYIIDGQLEREFDNSGKVNTTGDYEGLLVACGASHNRGSGQAAAERADQGGGAGEARRAGGGAGEAAPARSA
jgi:hypothetical protein